jgi:hypothetical protein
MTPDGDLNPHKKLGAPVKIIMQANIKDNVNAFFKKVFFLFER